MRSKQVHEVQTYDGRTHEVDMKQIEKAFRAWGFVDNVLIEGENAKTTTLALTSWKRAYKERFETAGSAKTNP